MTSSHGAQVLTASNSICKLTTNRYLIADRVISDATPVIVVLTVTFG
jgi:hypothetical protein